MIIETETLIAGIVMIVLGLFFFFNSKNIGKGASKFYKAVCTPKNLKIIFKIIAIILIVAGIIVILVQ